MPAKRVARYLRDRATVDVLKQMTSLLTFEQLVDFLERRMSMSHVYQPVLIRALIEAGGAATVRQLAQVFLAETRASSSSMSGAFGRCRSASSRSTASLNGRAS